MNRILAVSLATLLAIALPAHDAEAKRLGGGGIKRSVPTQTTPQTPPAQTPQQAAPAKQAAATPAAPAAAAPKRSWLASQPAWAWPRWPATSASVPSSPTS